MEDYFVKMCKYKKSCPNYDKSSNTCNQCPDNEIVCGKYGENENEKSI